MELSGLSRARSARLVRIHCTRGRTEWPRIGIITTTQDAITGVARTGIQGARSIAGSAADTAAGAANSAAKAVTGAALNAVRGARRLVGPAKKRKTAKRRAKAKKAVKRKATRQAQVRRAKPFGAKKR